MSLERMEESPGRGSNSVMPWKEVGQTLFGE